ncbi:endo-1,4-beta-xylanase [Pseudomonas sp. MH9.3]|uniref:endo-1,4-beta-xylanase n=1 Tax=Pseudomonas sp. MH9.3 TaxID=3048630 RepID=UPI002AC911C4|nr:endo-1,4-beta-xylanase [Pseudomonas sp. MH9.3]MEB0107086.1 endo-1,4-beta-xylanase [Pseudomonas sp. MH9.3]WPX80298.1 endo-1,4-beta-xylanase [Pseudomonas sp. MH9.3]
MKPFNRRRFLTTTLQAMVLAPLLRVRPALADDTFRPLRAVAAQHGLSFGFAVDPALLDTNPSYRDVVARQAGIVVPENALKWAQVHPAPDRYTFAPVDLILAFAQANHQRMRGHTLCWHRALPDWVTRTVTPANAKEVLTQHIAAVVGRYRGRIASWDVVNEAIQVDDGQAGGLRDAFWYRMLGPDYIDLAYEAAHRADPDAALCYNEYGLESDSPAGTRKRAAVLALLRTLKQRGVPVHALGIQSHLRAADPHGFGPGLAAFLRQVHDLGLSIYITELDVDDSHVTGDANQRDAIVAGTYKRYLDLVLGTGTVSAVLTWGVWDTAHRTGATPSMGPLAQRPLVFGPQGVIKPASWVVEHSLAWRAS